MNALLYSVQRISDALYGVPNQWHGLKAQSAVDAILDRRKVYTVLDFFPFFDAKVGAISIDHLVILSQQLCGYGMSWALAAAVTSTV